MGNQTHEQLKAYALETMQDPCAIVECTAEVEGQFHGSMLGGPVFTGAQTEILRITIRRPLDRVPSGGWFTRISRPAAPDALVLTRAAPVHDALLSLLRK